MDCEAVWGGAESLPLGCCTILQGQEDEKALQESIEHVQLHEDTAEALS